MTPKILVIDDDHHVYQAVRNLLGHTGETVAWANLPEKGIRMAIQDLPDVILLDVNMPNMDGLKVCRHLRETEATRDTPILFLTVEDNIDSMARALDCGGSDYILKPFHKVDLRARVRAALRTKGMIDLLKEQARVDALTGLANRAGLEAALASAVASFDRLQQPFALLMIDLDHFKGVNDRYGLGVGHELLCEVASKLTIGSRPYDTACRFGGDEFGVVLGQASVKDAARAAERILSGIPQIELSWGDAELEVTCSAGLATMSDMPEGFGPGEIVTVADQALYEAKRRGRNRLCLARDL